VYRHTVFISLHLSQYIFIGTTLAAGRNLFPWIWFHKGAMNSSKLATPICLISCIRTVAGLCFFSDTPKQFVIFTLFSWKQTKYRGRFWF